MRHQLSVVYLCPICLTALADTGSKHGNLVQCLDDEVDLRLDRREHETLFVCIVCGRLPLPFPLVFSE